MAAVCVYCIESNTLFPSGTFSSGLTRCWSCVDNWTNWAQWRDLPQRKKVSWQMGQTGLSGGTYLRGKRWVDKWDKLGSVEGLTSEEKGELTDGTNWAQWRDLPQRKKVSWQMGQTGLSGGTYLRGKRWVDKWDKLGSVEGLTSEEKGELTNGTNWAQWRDLPQRKKVSWQMGQTGLSGGTYLRGKRWVDRWDKLGSVEGLTSEEKGELTDGTNWAQWRDLPQRKKVSWQMGQTGLSGGTYLRGKRWVDRWDKLGSVEGLTSYFFLAIKN